MNFSRCHRRCALAPCFLERITFFSGNSPITLTNGLFSTPLSRGQFPVCERWTYFDHAAVAAIPRVAHEAVAEYLNDLIGGGDTLWPKWAEILELTRSRASQLIDCDRDEIALVPNTTFGINVVANGLDYRPGDNVVVPANEFPSNLLPWRLLERCGVEVRTIEGQGDVLVEQLVQAIDQRTRIVSLSWVHYLTGYRMDLRRICDAAHAMNSLVMVDAIQGLGAFPISAKAIPFDFLAADGHKWMLGPEGAGLLYIRSTNLDRLKPLMMGWGSVESSYRFDPEANTLKANASRYEGGSMNMAGHIGLASSLELLLQAGAHRFESAFAQSILDRTRRLEIGLRSINARLDRHPFIERQSGILSFDFPDTNMQQLRSALLEAGFVTSVRHGKLRVAIHGYNSDEEVDRFIAHLQSR